eukprot:m.14035 g.14035  ORF g.14035 m.14035 type:complete len:464 (+) comp4972_c0_seq1:256-1647(+)
MANSNEEHLENLLENDGSPADATKTQGISRLQAAFNIIKCNWGVGMMAMPYMLDKSGTITGVIMFVISMALTQFSIVNILMTKERIEKVEAIQATKKSINDSNKLEKEDGTLDYSGLMAKSLGAWGDYAALFCIVLSSYGSNIAYIEFIKENMMRMFSHVMSSLEWVAIILVPLLGLSTLNNVGFLAPFSLFGLMCAFSFGVIIVVLAMSRMSPEEFYDRLESEPIIKVKTLPLAMSIAAFCNEGIVVLTPSTQNSMRNPKAYAWTSFWSICFFTVCYMSVGISGNILFYENVESDLSLNLNPKNVIAKVAVVLYSLQLIPSYAVVYYCAYEALENKWLRYQGITNREKYLSSNKRTGLLYIINRWFWVCASAGIALLIPKFGDYVGLVGALANSLAIYIMPQVCYLRMVAPTAKKTTGQFIWTIACWLLIIFGVALAIFGTYQSGKGLFFPSHNKTSSDWGP